MHPPRPLRRGLRTQGANIRLLIQYLDIFIREMAEGKAYRYVCGRTDIQAAQMSGFSQPDPGGDGRLPSYKRNSIPAKERKKKKWEEDKVPTCTSRILDTANS